MNQNIDQSRFTEIVVTLNINSYAKTHFIINIIGNNLNVLLHETLGVTMILWLG